MSNPIQKPFGEDFIRELEEAEAEWNEERTDIVGSNGNDGLHYNQELDFGDDND